jgi:DNA (cytosine-5)-methyltransferase 1
MRIGSLFSGIGGLELGLEWSGIGETVWQVEKDPYCRRVLEKHWPGVKRYNNVENVGTKFKTVDHLFGRDNLEPVDLICGGFPCQDVSAAGAGAGLSGARSGLWYEFLRVVTELRPSWVVVENVASGATRWVDAVRAGLVGEGYASLPIPLSAQDCGAPHLRRRVFIVAHTNQKRRGERTGTRQEHTVAHANGEQTERVAESREKRDPWAIEPDVGRVANGVPARVDRLKALGNAVVPQCAQVIGEFIKQLT